MFAKLAKAKNMSALAEASELFQKIAEPRPVGDSVQQAIERAYNKILTRTRNNPNYIVLRKWTRNRAKDIWQGSRRAVVAADELRELRAVAGVADEIEADRAELRILHQRLARLEEAMRVSDQAFYRPEIDALGEQIERVGRMDRAMALNRRSTD